MPASASDARPLVIVRADASAAIGLGHVMRSLTLARALAEEGCDVRFIGAGIPVAARSDLPGAVHVSDRVEVTGDEADAASVLAERPDLVVVDGYHITAGFFRALENAGTPYAVIDDNYETAARSPVLVLNQNPHATAELYRELQGEPTLLLGLEHALIRLEVLATARRNLPRQPGTVFVSMGGSDPRGLTVSIAKRLAGSGARVLVAVGPAHPARAEVLEQLAPLQDVVVIKSDEFVTALATSGMAVLGAGSSLWEAACLGTPSVAVVVADNQWSGASEALRTGVVIALHDARDASSDVTVGRIVESASNRKHIRTGADCIVDGRGAERVGRAIRVLLTQTAHS